MASHIRSFSHLKSPISKLASGWKVLLINRSCSNFSLQNLDHRNELFSLEQKRLIESVGRIEKIVVNVSGRPEDVTLYMNQDLSTPYDCAKHISENVVQRAALALIDSKIPWDMHRPLKSNCSLKFLYFDDEDPTIVNKAFWESCSIILGKVISTAFKDDVTVMLYGYPKINVRSGSFVYDAQLSLNEWKPSYDELRILAAEMFKFIYENHKFERLHIDKELALKIMEGNPFKEAQINDVANKNEDGKVTLYRVGTHIDVSQGPLISNTSLINRCSITAVHKIQTKFGPLYRFQGVGLPKPLNLNHFAYSVLENRARKMNRGQYMKISAYS